MGLRACESFFFNDTATTEIYTLSLHDALPISRGASPAPRSPRSRSTGPCTSSRSEEHTSELQSRQYLVCRLLLEKKKHGYAPSFEEIRNGMKLNSLATVHKHITTLAKKGFIRR